MGGAIDICNCGNRDRRIDHTAGPANDDPTLREYLEGLAADGHAGSTRYFSENGWAVAIVTGKFALSGKSAFFVKANHTPGMNVPAEDRTKANIAVFSTEPRAN